MTHWTKSIQSMIPNVTCLYQNLIGLYFFLVLQVLKSYQSNTTVY